MAQIGFVVDAIFEPEMTYGRYVEELQGHIGSYGRLVSEDEFDELRSCASSARSGVQVLVQLPSWSPRFHIANARRAFLEMRAAHDRLFNVLDAYLAWATGSAAARAQVGTLQDPVVAGKAARQVGLIQEIKAARARQRENVRNAVGAAQEVARMYERPPWNQGANDVAGAIYYERMAEQIRYSELLNQWEGLAIADSYDDSAVAALMAEAERTNLEFAMAATAVQNFEDRQVLLGFDFTVRIVDALKDVFQNAAEVVAVGRALWGLSELEKKAPNHRQGDLHGWFFSFGDAFWPPWMSLDELDSARYLLSDHVLAYLDQSERLLAVMERDVQAFGACEFRTLVSRKVMFTRTADGSSRAVVRVPALARYQEVGAIFLRRVPASVATVTLIRPVARVAVVTGMNRQLACIAELKESNGALVAFGSDGGMGGDAPTFALESECLVCSNVGDQSIELVCRNDSQPEFEVDCILRVSGFNKSH